MLILTTRHLANAIFVVISQRKLTLNFFDIIASPCWVFNKRISLFWFLTLPDKSLRIFFETKRPMKLYNCKTIYSWCNECFFFSQYISMLCATLAWYATIFGYVSLFLRFYEFSNCSFQAFQFPLPDFSSCFRLKISRSEPKQLIFGTEF